LDWSDIIIKGLVALAAVAGAVAAFLNWLRPRNPREEGSTSSPTNNSTRTDNSTRVIINADGDVNIYKSFNRKGK
jgi:hypothetical protein